MNKTYLFSFNVQAILKGYVDEVNLGKVPTYSMTIEIIQNAHSLLFTLSGFPPCVSLSAGNGCPVSLSMLLPGVSAQRSEQPSERWVDTTTAGWSVIQQQRSNRFSWDGNFSLSMFDRRWTNESVFISPSVPAECFIQLLCVYLTPASWLKTYQNHTYAHTDTHSHTINHCHIRAW